MGSYTQYITNEGENLIAQALSGGILTFTQVVTSASLVVGTEDEIRLITDIAGVQQTTAPSAAVRTGDNTIRVSATFENTGVEKSYAVQTVGLYAKVGEEPQKLFAIAQAQKPSEMPDENKTSYASVIFNFNITVQNAKEIEITVTPGGALPSDVFYSMFPGLNPPTTEDAGKLVQINEKGKWEYGIADAVLSAKSENPIQNKVVNDAIEKLNKAVEDANQAIANAMELRASLTDYGMTKVTNSAAVTDSTGLALAATEKNALIPGTLAQQISQLNTDYSDGWKTNPNTYVPVTYGDGFEKINISDQVRCSRLNNGMRCITGALHTYKEISLLEDVVKAITVPDDFALIDCGIMYQKWISLIETSSGKAYNFLFSGNGFYAWGYTTIPANSTLSIYLLY